MRENLLLYDRVIANPPFSLDEWGRDVAEKRRFRALPLRRPAEDQGRPGVRPAHGGSAERSPAGSGS